MKQYIKRNKYLILMALTVLAINLINIAINGPKIEKDTSGYIALANNLLQNKGFINKSGLKDFFRTPGYPLFIAICLRIFNQKLMSIVIIQSFFASINLVLIYYSVYYVTQNKKWAYIASFAFMISPLHYSHDVKIMSESLFLFLVMWTIFTMIYWFAYKEKDSIFFVFSLCINLALLVRPVLIYANIILIVALIIFIIFKIRFQIRHLLIYLCVFLVLAGGWIGRNYSLTGEWFISTVSGWNEGYYNCPEVMVYKEKIELEEAQQRVQDEIFHKTGIKPSRNNLDYINASSQWSTLYRKQNIKAYLFCFVKGVLTTLFGTGFLLRFLPIENNWILQTIMTIGIVILMLIYLVYAISLIKSIKKLKLEDVFMLGLIAYLTVTSGIVGYSRFRNPIMPLIFIAIALLQRGDDGLLSSIKNYFNKKSTKNI